jgi:hypothetical protein
MSERVSDEPRVSKAALIAELDPLLARLKPVWLREKFRELADAVMETADELRDARKQLADRDAEIVRLKAWVEKYVFGSYTTPRLRRCAECWGADRHTATCSVPALLSQPASPIGENDG